MRAWANLANREFGEAPSDMKVMDVKKSTRNGIKKRSVKPLIPALLAGGIAASPANALELGDIQVQSSLGQPLRASIAFALGPNEELQDYCVAVSNVASSSGLPALTDIAVRISGGVISLTGNTAVREPMASTRINIDCPYAPRISREYLMFIDPAGLAYENTTESVVSTPVAAAPQATAVRQPAPQRSIGPAVTTPVSQGTRYRVQPGETLSQIVQRIENRSVSLWPAVNSVFEANPDAFINSDPNRLKAGSWLVIPDFVGNEVATFAATPSQDAAPEPQLTETAELVPDTAQAAVESTGLVPDAAETITDPVVSESVSEPAEALPAANQPAATAFKDLKPGDILLDDENPYTSSDTETVVIEDTALESPTVADNPNRQEARIVSTAASTSDSSSSTWWWAGGGIALIAGLLLFGRRLRDRFGSTPIGAAIATPEPEEDREPTQTVQISNSEVGLSDDSPTEENLALDSELIIGNMMDHPIDVDFTEDFEFPSGTKVDIELPDDERPVPTSSGGTDIIPPPQIETSSILESEVLPDNTGYDMSVIMDVTKMPRPEDVTEKDLQAIEVESSDETLIDSSYTVNKEIDYDILEQDYEDELSATQALNMEIEKAAQQLARQLKEDADPNAETANIQIGDVTNMTSEQPAQNDELSDLDDTGINEAVAEITEEIDTDEPTVDMDRDEKTVEMIADESTVQMESEESTVEMPIDDATAEMPVASEDTVEVTTTDGDRTVEIVTRDDDSTMEMEVESGKIDTKAG